MWSLALGRYSADTRPVGLQPGQAWHGTRYMRPGREHSLQQLSWTVITGCAGTKLSCRRERLAQMASGRYVMATDLDETYDSHVE